MAEFDSIAEGYTDQHTRSIRFSGETVDYFARYKVEDARRLADKRGVKVGRILDFGSGIGNSLLPMRVQFPHAPITCLDVSGHSIDLSREKGVEGTDFRTYDGIELPSDLGKFDLIFTACVFHHIHEDLHVSLLRQLRQKLCPGGFVLLFEHNPWNPVTRHAVKNCPFDENAVLISSLKMKQRFEAAGFADTKVHFRVFFPGPLAAFRRIDPVLSGLPLGAQYSIAAA